jgi:hypothetical protein
MVAYFQAPIIFTSAFTCLHEMGAHEIHMYNTQIKKKMLFHLRELPCKMKPVLFILLPPPSIPKTVRFQHDPVKEVALTNSKVRENQQTSRFLVYMEKTLGHVHGNRVQGCLIKGEKYNFRLVWL